MAATRLTDSQKSEMVARYRKGEGSSELAGRFGCSVNTVSRVVKAALPASEYEELKRERARAARQGSGGKASGGSEGLNRQGEDRSADETRTDEPRADESHTDESADLSAELEASLDLDDEATASPQNPGGLTIDDAEDFTTIAGPGPVPAVLDSADFDGDGLDDLDDNDLDDNALEDSDLDGEGADGDDTGADLEADGGKGAGAQAEPVRCLPLLDAELPGSVYMLVDKTVELDARPLREFSELGPLPDDEEERQALQVFINPRQAKRHCGRSQRVIKLPDARVLERTASYLLAKGISRVVIEGSLYALPGS